MSCRIQKQNAAKKFEEPADITYSRQMEKHIHRGFILFYLH